jgi:hypothetical protein
MLRSFYSNPVLLFSIDDSLNVPVLRPITRGPLPIAIDACCGASRRHIFFIAV